MRVLHLGKYFAPFAGGIENFMLDLLPACSKLGVEQACLVHESPGGAGRGERRFDFPVEVRRVPMMGQLSYAPISPAFRRALEETITDFRPDLIHLHMPNTSAFWALFDSRGRKLPWVVHWHSDAVGPGLDFRLKALYPIYRPFEQRLLRRAAAVISTSPPYLESSQALRRWRGKCRVIPLGLDPARLETIGNFDDGWRFGDKLRVLAVGRLSRYKGFETLIRAAGEVDGVEVIIAGEGEQRRRLERLLARSASDSASDRIRLVGAVDDADRNFLMVGCDVLCMPSINRAEAFGLALLEAMAAGKPQIATRVAGSGMDWVVEEGRTGWMVAPGDVDELAALLRRLVRNRSTVASFGAHAREQFEERFRIDAVARQVVGVYREILGNP